MTVHSTSSRPPNDDDLDPALLERYWLGEATPDETTLVEAWLVARPEWRTRYHQLREGLQAGNWTAWSETDTNRAVARALESVGIGPIPDAHRVATTAMSRAATTESKPGISTGYLSSRAFRGVAASRHGLKRHWQIALAVTGAVVAVVLIGQRRTAIQETARSGHSRNLQYETAAGQRATVTLADGSRITLAPQSRVMVASDFGRVTRTVALSGEAYFQVAPAGNAPFLVQTGDIVTRVLGTTFDVRRYNTDAHVQVAVVSGKVATGNRRTFVTLTAGTVGQVTDSIATSLAASDVQSYVSWTAGRLTFRDTRVADVLQALEHWYGVEILLPDSVMLASRVTLTLDQKSQAEAMVALESLLNVSASFDGATADRTRITLHPKRQTSKPRTRENYESLSTSTEVGR